jgi:hypothetical protein
MGHAMNAAAFRHRRSRLAWLLMIVPAIVYVATAVLDMGNDGGMMYRVTESLVLRHSFQVTDPFFHIQQPFSNYGLGVSLALIPLFSIGWLLFHDGTRLIVLFDPLVTAGTVVALSRLLLALGATYRRSVALSLLFAFGSLAWFYSGQLFSEPLTALALTLAVLWSLRYRHSGRRKWLVASGAAVAVSVLARPDSILLVALPLTAYIAFVVVRRHGWRWPAAVDLMAYGSCAGVGLVADLWYNWLRYGNPVNNGYPIEFSTPLLQGLYGLLFSPGAGLFVFVPFLLLSSFGARGFFQKWRPEAALTLAIVGGRILFYAGWWGWDGGGGSWGPRYLLPIVPMLAVFLLFLPNTYLMRVALVAAGALGVGIETLGQLVPYHLYYTSVSGELSAMLHLPACTTCGVVSVRAIEAMKGVLDYDWHYAPLLGQVRMLLHGDLAPVWLIRPERAVVIPIAMYALVRGVPDMLRSSARLDASPGPDEASSPTANEPRTGSDRLVA